ncbi:hypothetical protein AURDEDRAFT_114501 [Auricularia subglabra TFB-10046 SS5]|nr:hypothetical protein AURDEDRAFT_114501 [Auricularia subglabra TFB-10046 SS5]
MAQATRYNVTYFKVPALADLPRMILDVAGVPYENTFFEYMGNWQTFKGDMTFGRVPRLTIFNPDGSKKELFESFVIEAYLVETLGFLPGSDAFSRAEGLSVASSLKDLDERVAKAGDQPTAEARRAAHEKNIMELIPSFLRYYERFIAARGGPYFFGDKLTVGDLKFYILYLKYRAMYGDKSPIGSGQYPKLAKLAEILDSGRAGDYARNRRFAENHVWNEEEQKWAVNIQAD